MQQFHLNDVLERATKFYRRVEKDRGLFCTWFGTFARDDYVQSEQFMTSLEKLIALPVESRGVAFRNELPRIKEGILYVQNNILHLKCNYLDEATSAQYSSAIDYVATIPVEPDPRPVSPAA